MRASSDIQRDRGDISGNNYSIIGLLIIRIGDCDRCLTAPRPWDEVKLDMTSYGSAVRTRGWPSRRDLAAAVVSSLEGDTRPTGGM